MRMRINMEVEEKESRSNEEYNQRDSREEESLEKDLNFFCLFSSCKTLILHYAFFLPSPFTLRLSRAPATVRPKRPRVPTDAMPSSPRGRRSGSLIGLRVTQDGDQMTSVVPVPNNRSTK